MAFIEYGGTILSFATSDDLESLDARLFEQNEGLSDDYVQDQLIRSTQRILEQLRSTDWWQQYYLSQSGSGATSISNAAQIPPLDPTRILARRSDFTELCCFHAFYYYILPYIADFGNEDSAERRKMGYYQQKYNEVFGDLITDGDWYDFDDSGTVTDAEKQPGVSNLRRVR
jgi:hypothetical protein